MEPINRRDMVLGTAGLLAVATGTAEAQPRDAEAFRGRLDGEWRVGDERGASCAIFQHGILLLVVNEKGKLAVAGLSGDKIVITQGFDHWKEDVTGRIGNRGRSIRWSNGANWVQA
jgi:hypothetical protein